MALQPFNSTNLPNGIGQGCLTDTRNQSYGLVISYDYQCSPGYYCPLVESNNPSSLPTFCPPTTDCQIKRLFSDVCVVIIINVSRINDNDMNDDLLNSHKDCTNQLFVHQETTVQHNIKI